MNKFFPKPDLRVNLHFYLKIHVCKRNHGMLVTILNRSGIGWNDSKSMIGELEEEWETFINVKSPFLISLL